MNKEFDILPLMRSYHPLKSDEELFKMACDCVMDRERGVIDIQGTLEKKEPRYQMLGVEESREACKRVFPNTLDDAELGNTVRVYRINPSKFRSKPSDAFFQVFDDDPASAPSLACERTVETTAQFKQQYLAEPWSSKNDTVGLKTVEEWAYERTMKSLDPDYKPVNIVSYWVNDDE